MEEMKRRLQELTEASARAVDSRVDSLEKRLEERDRLLMETLRSMQEQAASEHKRRWWPFRKKK